MKETTSRYLATAEGKIFAGGIALGAAWIVLLIVLSTTQLVVPKDLLAMLATVMVAGRAGGISMGQEMGLPTWLIVVNATIADSLTVLFLYPLFVFSARNMVDKPLVNQMLGPSIKNAEANRGKISRFGVIGLLLFVLFPLHMTGPLVGSIIGYFMGLNPYVNIAVVLTGTLIAVICWVAVFAQLASQLGQWSGLIPAFVIIMALIAFLVVRAKHRKANEGDKT